MQMNFSPRHEVFRDQVRRFLDGALDDELRHASRTCPGIFQDYEVNIRWHRILHKQGWVAPAWPQQYGGTGWDLIERYIWTTECSRAEAPGIAPMGVSMCGPMLIGHGTPEQKAFYLPRILSGEDYWCQGYSEPTAGSDLAALKLRAESDGDHYVLNGSKIWTTHAHYANRMFCLVRTRFDGKAQAGITFVLLDMQTPGIEVKPIRFASGIHEVNQVFFDNVRVPKINRVGKENEGWTVAKYLLEFERGGGGSARMQGKLQRLRRGAESLLQEFGNTALLARVNQATVEYEGLLAMENRVMAALSRNGSPGPESSLLKTMSANLSQRLTELDTELQGATAVVHDLTGGAAIPSELVPGAVAFQQYFNNRASSIAGGSNEVQKNIVAKLVLGL